MTTILTRQGASAITDPSEARIAKELRALRSYGASAFAHLTRDDGSYVQVGGGGVTCVVERRDPKDGPQLRAYYIEPRVSFEDGTILSFAGSRIALRRDEWLRVEAAIAIFVAFLHGRDFPSEVGWRDVSNTLT